MTPSLSKRGGTVVILIERDFLLGGLLLHGFDGAVIFAVLLVEGDLFGQGLAALSNVVCHF